MPGRTQTLPWRLGGEGVKTTENKIHRPRWLKLWRMGIQGELIRLNPVCLLGSSCQYKRFLFCLGHCSRSSTNYFFSHRTLFHFTCPYRASKLGRQSYRVTFLWWSLQCLPRYIPPFRSVPMTHFAKKMGKKETQGRKHQRKHMTQLYSIGRA